MATGDSEGLVEQLADVRDDSLSELGRREDQLQRDAQEFLANPPPPPGRRHRAVGTAPAAAESATPTAGWPPGSPALPATASHCQPLPATATVPIAQDTPRWPTQVPVAFAWFPATDYPEALRRWPQLTQQGAAKGAADHVAYTLALQRTSPGTPTPGPPGCTWPPSGSNHSSPGANKQGGTRPPPMPGPGTPRNCSAEPTPR